MNIKELWLYTRIKKELLHEKLEEIEDATKRILQQNNIENSNIENIEKDSNTTAFLYMIQYAHKTGKITEDQAKKIKLTLKLY
jgi:intergrase/recombinase